MYNCTYLSTIFNYTSFNLKMNSHVLVLFYFSSKLLVDTAHKIAQVSEALGTKGMHNKKVKGGPPILPITS